MNPYDMPDTPRKNSDEWQRCNKCDKEFIDEDLHAYNNTLVCEPCLTEIENTMPNERLNEIVKLLSCNDLTTNEIKLLVLECRSITIEEVINELSKFL